MLNKKMYSLYSFFNGGRAEYFFLIERDRAMSVSKRRMSFAQILRVAYVYMKQKNKGIGQWRRHPYTFGDATAVTKRTGLTGRLSVASPVHTHKYETRCTERLARGTRDAKARKDGPGTYVATINASRTYRF